MNIHAFSPKRGLITPKSSKYTEVEANINGIEITEIDFLEVAKDENIVKIMLIDEPEILDEAISKLPKEAYEKYNIVKSTPFYFEKINKAVTSEEAFESFLQSAFLLNLNTDDVCENYDEVINYLTRTQHSV